MRAFLSCPFFVVFCLPLSVFATDVVKKHGDWELICSDATAAGNAVESALQNPDGSKKNNCRLAQHHAVADTKEALLIANVLVNEQGRPVAILSVPAGVYLAPGILIRVDSNKPFKLLYETCNPSGCHAGFELKPSVLNAFKRGAVAEIRFFNPQQKSIDVKVSLAGFTKGLAALSEGHR